MRLSLFPYTPEVATLIRNRSALKKYVLHSIISFKEDLERLEKLNQQTGILCTDSIEAGLQQTDELVLLPENIKTRWQKYYDCIDYAVQNGITIYGTSKLLDMIPEEKYKQLIQLIENTSGAEQMIINPSLFDIDIPVIAVTGLGENCGKFECELEVKQYIDSLGYQCMALSSNPLGVYAGMELLPNFVFSDKIALHYKIFLFNRYIYARCREEKPDVLLISIPGGVIQLSQNDRNFFFEIPIAISSAVHIDVTILTVYYANAPLNFLDQIANDCQKRFAMPIKSFYMARQLATMEPGNDFMQFFSVSDEYIISHRDKIASREDTAIPLEDHSKVYQRLIHILQNNLNTF